MKFITLFTVLFVCIATNTQASALSVNDIIDAAKSKQGTKKSVTEHETVQNLLGTFFSKTSCLSSDDQKKLSKVLKKDKKSAIPKELQGLIDNIPNEKVELIEALTLRGALHVYTRENEAKPVILDGALSYRTLDPFLLLDTEKPNFFYRLDCNAYLASLVSSNIGFSSTNLKSAVEGAYEKKEFYQASRAFMYNVIEKVMNPINIAGSEFNAKSRASILFPLASDMIDKKYNSIKVPKYIDVVAFDHNSSRGLQGKVDIDGKGSYSFGFGGAAIDLKASASISEKFRFSAPNSAIIESGPISEYSIKRVKESLSSAIIQSKLEVISSRPLVAHADLYQKLCLYGGWKAEIVSISDNEVLGTNLNVHPKYLASDICQFSIDLQNLSIGSEAIILSVEAASSMFSSFDKKPIMRAEFKE